MTERQVALRSGIGVAIVIAVLGVVSTILGIVPWGLYGGFNGGVGAVGVLLSQLVGDIGRGVIVGAGVGLSLVFVRPVAEGASLRTILIRATIAAAIGAAANLVISTLFAFFQALSVSGPLGGYGFPDVTDAYNPLTQAVATLFGSLQLFVQELPVVVLVVLLVARFWRDLRGATRGTPRV